MHVCNPWNTHKRDGNRWICVSGTRTTFRKYLQLSWNILYLKQKCRMVLRSSNFVYDCLSLDFLAGILVGGCLLCTSYPFSKAVSSDPSFQQQIQSLYWRFSRFPSIIHGFPKSYRSFEAHSCAYFSKCFCTLEQNGSGSYNQEQSLMSTWSSDFYTRNFKLHKQFPKNDTFVFTFFFADVFFRSLGRM